jgi:riboflavin kinase/FMN adenylyltransferase
MGGTVGDRHEGEYTTASRDRQDPAEEPVPTMTQRDNSSPRSKSVHSGHPCSVAVIAGFDGVHRGHVALAEASRRLAERQVSACIAVVLNTERHMLQPVPRRCELLLEAGMEAAAAIDLAAESPPSIPELVDHLRHALGVGHVVCTRSCDDPLARALRSAGVTVTEISRTMHKSAPINSARIKATMARGDVEEVREMLGRHTEYTGVVMRGAQLGRTLGFPTANLAYDPYVIWPSCGVYYGTVTTQAGDRFPAAVNIGVRPTVDNAGLRLMEAHLLGFDADLYDQPITVQFRKRLRDEQAFESLEALTQQLRRDVELVGRLVGEDRE